METQNEKKARILGMPFGTANNRLRKAIIFHLAKKLNMDICYRCKLKIDNLETFSVEHTESWLYSKNPVEVFFDVEKIAFSHITCNTAAGIKPSKYENEAHRSKEKNKRRRSNPSNVNYDNLQRRLKRKTCICGPGVMKPCPIHGRLMDVSVLD